MQNKLSGDDCLPFVVNARFDLEHKEEALEVHKQIETWRAENQRLLTVKDQVVYEMHRDSTTADFVFFIVLSSSTAKESFCASLPITLTFIQKDVDRRIKEVIDNYVAQYRQ